MPNQLWCLILPAFISQDALSHRAEMNKLAALGEWDNGMEED